MTNEQKPREFWLELGNECDDIVWNLPVNENTIHVIEYSAYEEVKEQNEKLIKMIEVLNDENKLHIKLLEKVNDWAIAGNIENYSQLCDDLEKIQEDEK